MTKIRNINSDFGDGVVFKADTLEEAISDMLEAIKSCGYTPDGELVEGTDYEIVKTYAISDGNATHITNDFCLAIELAEGWYDYLDCERPISDFSEAETVEELNQKISAYENGLAEFFGGSTFQGHGNYSVSAASQAGYNLSVSVEL